MVWIVFDGVIGEVHDDIEFILGEEEFDGNGEDFEDGSDDNFSFYGFGIAVIVIVF